VDEKSHFSPTPCTVGEVDFWIFWILNFLQFAIDVENNSKTKVEKVFFFIFISRDFPKNRVFGL
jgi:hypothetical protein